MNNVVCIIGAVVAGAAGLVVGLFLDGPDAPCTHTVQWVDSIRADDGQGAKFLTVSNAEFSLEMKCEDGEKCPEIRACTLPPPPGTKKALISFSTE